MRHREKNSPYRADEIRIVGIDPGSVTCGYGVIKTALLEPSTPIYVTSGSISLSPKTPLHLRLKQLYDALVDVIREYKPQEMVVEHIFFAKSAKAALSLGHTRGVTLLAAEAEGLDLYEYSALEAKKAVTGYGRAEKRQVQNMVMRILFPGPVPRAPGFILTRDSADALALAICHLNTIKLREALTTAHRER